MLHTPEFMCVLTVLVTFVAYSFRRVVLVNIVEQTKEHGVPFGSDRNQETSAKF